MTTTHSVTVLGGTGHTGRRVVRRLRHRGIPVRVGSRAGAPAFHWERLETWAPLLDGAAAAFVAYTPDIAFPGADETMAALGEEARRLGLGRLVLLSGRGELGAARSEEALRSGGVRVTVLRSSWFAQDFSEHFLLDPVLAGVLALPTADVPERFIDLEDLADVAVEMLCRHQSVDTTLELTGPRLLTFADAAAELSKATGRRIDVVSVPPAEFVAGAVAAGVPGEEAAALTDLFVEVLDGRNASVSEDMQRVLGRPATDFAAFARRTADTGVWDQTRLTDRAGA
ncbi:MAG: NmrA family transcriptional regulator [Pseudonocardia sp.]